MRKFIEYILRQRLMILLFGALVLVAGLQSYRDLPVDAFPDVSPALVQVFGETEGLAPEEVERYVTYPIEVAMNGLPDLKEIRSVSNFGLSVVNIYFEDGTDIFFARQLVNERLQMAREEIPQGFSEPVMGPITTGLGQVLFFYLEDESGTRSAETMREIQDWIVKFNLQTVPGVTEVLSLGGEVKQFQVHVDPNALLRYGLTIADVTQAIRINNGNVGAQYIVKNSETFLIRSVGLARDATDLENIVLKTRDGVPVYVRDIGAVKIGGAVRQGLATMNGEGEVVAALVLKLIGTNTSKVIANVKERLKTINAALPPGVRILPYYDQSKIVSKSVDTVTSALFQGVVLVALVILAFMGGIRPSLVVALSIPFSIATAFILMRVMGMSANLMSLGGLAIAIGMMVDGAIVIVENADRLLHVAKRGVSKHQVIARACAEVVRPIGFAILIIIVVFLPIITLQGVEGKTFRPLALTTSLAMLGSLIFAVLIAPVLSEILMRSRQPSVRRGKVKTDNAERVLHLPLMWYQQTTGRPGEPYKAIADSFLSNLRRWRRPTNGRRKKPKQNLAERILYLPLCWYQQVSGRPGEPYKAIADRIVSTLRRRRPINGQRNKPKSDLAERIVTTLLDFYRPILVQFVEIPRRALMLGGGMLAVGVLIFPFLGSEFVPRLNEGDLLIRMTMAPSISLESARETALRFEKRMLERFPEVERVVTRVGRGEVGAHADPVNNGEAFVGLKPQQEWPVKRTPDELFTAMSEAFEDFPGVQFNFTQPIAAAVDELLTGIKAELAIKLFGPDSDVLLEKANEIEKVVRTIDGAADIQVDQVTGTPQLRIVVDRDAISRFGINIDDVQSVIRAAVGGDTAGQIFEGIKRFDIVVRYIKEARATPEAIRAIVIRTPAGVLVPLEQIAHVEEIVGPRQNYPRKRAAVYHRSGQCAGPRHRLVRCRGHALDRRTRRISIGLSARMGWPIRAAAGS